jgi:hypothetical protein
MNRKSIIYLLMFVCAFVLPSFTYSHEGEKRIASNTMIQKPTDSLMVSVAFNNPQLIVTDERNALQQQLNTQELSNKELINVAKRMDSTFSKLVVLQERRYESVMDCLQRKTGFSESQIRKILKQKNFLDVLYVGTNIIFIFALIIVYNTSFRRLKENIFAPLAMVISCWVTIQITLTLLYPSLAGNDYKLFYELMTLAPS